MAYWIRRLALIASATAMAMAITLYALGPHAATSAAFERYRAAHRAGDAALVTQLTAAREIAFFDEQRRHALHSPRQVVEVLNYRQRMIVLGLRALVGEGTLPMAVLRDASPAALYEAARKTWFNAQVLDQMDVLFAVPTGYRSATGYLSMTTLPGPLYQKLLLALVGRTSLGFERMEDGTWVIDPTPLLDASAKEHEYLATRIEPSGNEFLMKFYFKADERRAQVLWQPLA